MAKAKVVRSHQASSDLYNLNMYGRIITRKHHLNLVSANIRTAATDGQGTIRVSSTACSADPDSRVLLKGMVKHEFGHELYTDFLAKSPILNRPLALSFYRALEDGRMEAKQRREWPGMQVDIQAALEIMVKRGIFSNPEANETLAYLFPNVLLYWTRGVFLGQSILESMYQKRVSLLVEQVGFNVVRQFLEIAAKGLESAQTSLDCVNLALKLEKFLQDQQDNGQQDGQDQQDNDQQDGQNSSQSGSGQDQQDNDQQDGQNSSSQRGIGLPGSQDPMEAISQSLLRMFDDQNVPETDFGSLMQQVLNEIAPPQYEVELLKKNAIENPQALEPYEALTREISLRVASHLEVLLESRIEMHTHLDDKGRKLSSRHLTRVKTSVEPRVFKVEEEVEGISTAVSVLLDISGSMDEILDGETTRLMAAVASARAAIQSMDRYGIPCSLHFFGDRLTEVKRFDQPWRRIRNLHWCWTENNTLTGQAIEEVAPELALREEERKLLMLVTDGIPAYPERACSALQECKRFDIEVALMFINSNESTYESLYSQQFKQLLEQAGINWIEVSTSDQLADGLMKAIEESV
jgi:cobalamin biosynthesis protein CobT